MKILYAIQGTGNGHLSRARDVVPILEKKGEVDLLVSGVETDVGLPHPIKYQLKGLGFVFGKNGGVDLVKTFRQAKSKRFLKEIINLPVQDYDLILNDFEPVSAWASRLRGKPCIGLSHQAAVMEKTSPRPESADPMGRFILRRYAPVTARYGFHFSRFAPHIFTPVIRKQLRDLEPTDEEHYTVYLPSYDDERINEVLSLLPPVQWQVFSKHNKKPWRSGNTWFRPVDNEAFLRSMASCRGILCGAGFETPAEALYLGKKLLVIPMKNQYEQQCNAAALKAMGVPVIKSLRKKHLPTLAQWIAEGRSTRVDYPDETEKIIDLIIANHCSHPESGSALVPPGVKATHGGR